MKKLIPLFLVVGLLVGAVPALAGDGDVQFFADKTITLTETFTYTETATFTGTGLFQFDGEAWAKIQEQQELYNLTLTFGNDISPTNKNATIAGSFNDATGIANVNQSPGNLNNQGNEVAFSIGQAGIELGSPAEPGTFRGMFCEAEVVSVQYNGILYHPENDTREAAPNTLTTGNQITRDSIETSFNGFTGIANVNQSAGNLNNQGNAVAIAGGLSEQLTTAQTVAKAATDIMLAQNNAYNVMREGDGFDAGNAAADSITGSFNNSFGVSNVNQAAGSLNNQKNAVAIAFSSPRQ